MPAILEPIEAGLVIALINKYIINNNRLWEYLCGTNVQQQQTHEDINSCSSSSTTSINDAEIHIHHAY